MSDSRLIRDAARHKVTTLELFFDLVFVYGISQVTALLATDHSALGFVRGLLLAALLWWAWVAYSWLGTSVRIGQGSVQLAMFVAMGAIMVVALLMPDFFDEGSGASAAVLAASAYVVVRLMHLVLFYVAGREDPGITDAVLKLARTVVIAAVLLIGGAFLGGTWQLVLVAAAVSIDLIGPFLGGGRGWRLALGHFAERHGLIVIIALGEGIVAIGVGAAGLPISTALLTVAMLGVALACALWLTYFDGSSDAVESAVDARSGLAKVTTARDVYSYLHFLLVSGLILMALSMKSALKHVEKGWTEPLEPYAALALGLGLAQFLLGLWLMRRRAGAATSVGEPLVGVAALALVGAAVLIPTVAALTAAAALAVLWRLVRAPLKDTA